MSEITNYDSLKKVEIEAITATLADLDNLMKVMHVLDEFVEVKLQLTHISSLSIYDSVEAVIKGRCGISGAPITLMNYAHWCKQNSKFQPKGGKKGNTRREEYIIDSGANSIVNGKNQQ